MKKTILALTLTALAACAPLTDKTAITSPDGRISVSFKLDDGMPTYSIDVDGAPLVEPSALGLVAEEADLSGGFSLVSTKISKQKNSWTQPWGENKEITDSHRELAVGLRNEAGVLLNLVFRAFDDGVGFRYEYSVPGIDTLHICDELTRLNFASDASSWSIPGDFNSYEHLYRKMPLSQLTDANTPLTLKFSDSLYAAVHEAAIVDFPEMVLMRENGLSFKADLAPYRIAEDFCAITGGSFKTPWRTILIGRKAVDLVNSTLILNLNEPCAVKDVSWIRPMKYIGIWWGMHLGIENWGGEPHGATTERAIQYIDFAAENNIQGVLFEGWNDAWNGSAALAAFDFTRPASDFDVVKVAEYAQSKGVQLITHNETGGNFARFESQLDTSMAWAQSLGIHAAKTGYAGGGLWDGYPRHGQVGVNHFQRVIEVAAEHQIMVDAHESIKPSGLRRTWPNFMTRECVRGMEYNGWSEGNPPSHHEILPYTRILGGPVDYTPGVFDIKYRRIKGMPQVRTWGKPGTQCRVNTTLAKQIANWVVLYSPMQMACDFIENYEGHPAFQFFRDFDPDCDWSQALQGEVGEWIVVVRRAKGRYFLGATTDESGRAIDQPLDFLAPGTAYTAIIYSDALDSDWVTNPYAYAIDTVKVSSSDTLPLRLAPGGGCAISFFPEE